MERLTAWRRSSLLACFHELLFQLRFVNEVLANPAGCVPCVVVPIVSFRGRLVYSPQAPVQVVDEKKEVNLFFEYDGVLYWCYRATTRSTGCIGLEKGFPYFDSRK